MNGIRWFGPLTIFVAEPLPPEQAPARSRDSLFPTAATAAVVRLHRKWPDNPRDGYILK